MNKEVGYRTIPVEKFAEIEFTSLRRRGLLNLLDEEEWGEVRDLFL